MKYNPTSVSSEMCLTCSCKPLSQVHYLWLSTLQQRCATRKIRSCTSHCNCPTVLRHSVISDADKILKELVLPFMEMLLSSRSDAKGTWWSKTLAGAVSLGGNTRIYFPQKLNSLGAFKVDSCHEPYLKESLSCCSLDQVGECVPVRSSTCTSIAAAKMPDLYHSHNIASSG
eukprot:6457493-Amphidinium_carterae.1